MRKLVLAELAVLFWVGMVGIWILSVCRTKPVVPVLSMAETEMRAIEFPCAIDGTSLTAMNFAVYDGPFYEDGSGEEVFGVTALVIRNNGEMLIKEGTVTLESEDGVRSFFFTYLPAGASVLVPEAGRVKEKPEAVIRCVGDVELCNAEELDFLKVAHVDPVTLTVTNTDDESHEDICLYYKDHDSPSGMYIGGQTQCVTIPKLLPGQTITISPYRYVDEYSRIIMITAS